MTTITVIDIPLDDIAPSPSNPRKSFKRLEELAESIAASGVLQPVTVRAIRHDGNGDSDGDDAWRMGYELVLGERRWRASKIAKTGTIPALIREMTDMEVLEAQVVENGQRADVHPLEEAQGYQSLLDLGHTIETLAAKTGRSLSHLYGRLKLTRLAPAVRKAFLDDQIGVAIAELLARLPVLTLQEQALVDVLHTVSVDGIHAEEVDPDRNGAGAPADRQPLSFRAAQALIHRRYSTRLDLAKFEVADEQLVPDAGPCTTCPHRSGYRTEAQPALFPDLERPADVCTNPPCFEAKTAAVWEREAAAASARGCAVVAGDDAKEVFGYDGKTAPRSPYVDPGAEIPYELQKTPGKPTTWAKALGRDAGKVPVVMVQDPSGAPRPLLDKATAIEVLTAAGKIDKPAKPTVSSPATKPKKPAKSEFDQRALRDRVINTMAADAMTAAGKLSGSKETAWLRWIAEWVLELVDTSLKADSAVIAGLSVKEPWKPQLADRATNAVKLRQLLTGLAFADLVENSSNDPKDGGLIAGACKVLGIDAYGVVLAAIKASDKEAAKAAEKIDAAKKPSKGKGK